MSADPRTHETITTAARPSSPLPGVNGVRGLSGRPSPPPSSLPLSSSRLPSSSGTATRDINALRAAALKSSRLKKLKAGAQETTRRPTNREEGEISDNSEEDSASGSAAATAAVGASAIAAENVPGIVRQTVVTLSPNQESEVQSTMTKEDEAQYLSTLRNLMEELGVPPQDLVSNGAPFRLVTQACQEIVATSRRQAGAVAAVGAGQERAGDQWTTTRSPRREASETPGPGLESRPSTRAHSRMSSPEVEVTVHTNAMSPGSDSSTEAIVERMVPGAHIPDDPPVSIAPGPPAPVPAAIHIDTYRPFPRASMPQRHQPPAPPPPQHHPLHIAPTSRMGPAPHTAPPNRPRRRRRDLDSAAEGPATLNYGDDSDASKSPSPPPQEPPAPPPPPPALSPPPPPEVSAPAPVPAVKADMLAETRRRLLASRGRRKPGTPMSGASSSAPTPPPSLPSVKPPETAGSSVEVPMDIDEEVEDGEIQEEENEPVTAPRVASAEPVSRTSSRGVKRPHAEDLMDLPTRPTSAARLASRRRIFGTSQWTARLQVPLDGDSEDDESSDDDDDDGACDDAPDVTLPVIEIPPEWEVVHLIAEKEEHIRKLKEKIKALAAKKRGNGTAAQTASGTLTPSTEAKVAEAAEAAVAAMEGEQQGMLEAAARAINDDREGWTTEGGKPDSEDDKMDVDGDDTSTDPDTDAAAGASLSVCATPLTELSEKHHFQPYRPLLTHYPQLVPSASAAVMTTDASELTLDWGLLSSVILTHRLQRDPDATMCAFEAGGGRCTDVKCEDVHLVRAEPTDEDMVAYISQILALDGDDAPDGAVVADALTAAKADLDAAAAAHDESKNKSRAGSESAEGPLAQLLASATRRLRAQAQSQR